MMLMGLAIFAGLALALVVALFVYREFNVELDEALGVFLVAAFVFVVLFAFCVKMHELRACSERALTLSAQTCSN